MDVSKGVDVPKSEAKGHGLETSRWSSSAKDAVVEAFGQARDQLAGEFQTKLESSCGQQASGIARSWFNERIEELRLTAAGTPNTG